MEKGEVNQMWWCTVPLEISSLELTPSKNLTAKLCFCLACTHGFLRRHLQRCRDTTVLCYCPAMFWWLSGYTLSFWILKFAFNIRTCKIEGSSERSEGCKSIFFLCVEICGGGHLLCTFIFRGEHISQYPDFLLLISYIHEQEHRLCYFIFQIRKQTHFVVIKK